ncbi:tetratricopeptide repeat protein [Accumulibacter sp.]|uniref:tetratricopeptide repeat protein n=1 Tax=Accumulibacter sp. TaxID=2053492 RepID=UPI002627210A|nr:tetratricopeptide repeat protein [Accumulibacter sp.]
MALPAPSLPAATFGEDDVDGRHSGDLLRLQRLLEHGDGFQLVFAACLSFAYRQRLIALIGLRHPSAAIVDLQSMSETSALIDALRRIGPQHNPIHLVGVEAWLRQAGPTALQALNYRREALAADLPSTLILWLEPGVIARFASEAPDLWAWRTAVLDFSHPPAERQSVHRESIFLGGAERASRERRLAEIADYLRTLGEPGGPDAELMLEASDIERSLGRPEEALRQASAAREVFRRIGDRRGEAVAAGRHADILQSRGDLDEALRIRVEEQLPVYERLGDVRSKAVTQGQIADILQSRGDLDEALRIRVQEQLPVYERLGDVRSMAVTQGQIADILQSRGDLDEALRIRVEEQLPVYERLGDVREKAVTQGKIADILESRGDLGEALRLLAEEVLGAFERLGDVRSKAVTRGQIADILQSRGQLAEALALHEERLPVAERLGDIELIAHIRYSTARLRLELGEHRSGGLPRIRDDLAEAFALSRRLGRPDFIGVIGALLAQVLALGGERAAAREVLALAEEAFARLGHASGVQGVRALREAIAGA